MKLSAINSYNKNFSPKKSYSNFPQTKYNTSNVTFNGLFDLFQKQKYSPEQKQLDREIKSAIKSTIGTDKILKHYGKAFYQQISSILKAGSEQGYSGYMPYTDINNKRKNVTFANINKELNIPSVINIWENGSIKTIYEIYSITPQSVYHITDYKDGSETQYDFIGDRYLGYIYHDYDGLLIKQFPSENGFLQQQIKKTNDEENPMVAEIYYDYKNPEQSYYRESTEKGFVEYTFDKNQNMWFENRILPKEEYEKIKNEIK